MSGFQHRATSELPTWANVLQGYYWRVRVEGRDKTKRRRYYRYIRIERLRLVELGIELDEVEAVCKYLVSLKQINADRLHLILVGEPEQLRLDFFD